MADQPPVHVPSMVRLRPTPICCSALRFSQVGLHYICDSHGIIPLQRNPSAGDTGDHRIHQVFYNRQRKAGSRLIIPAIQAVAALGGSEGGYRKGKDRKRKGLWQHEAGCVLTGLMRSAHFDHSRHIAVAFRAQADEQQIARLDRPGKIGYRHFMTAFSAPDVGEVQLSGLLRKSLPKLCRGSSEFRYRFDGHDFYAGVLRYYPSNGGFWHSNL